MFGFKSARDQLIEQERKNAELNEQLIKTKADMEYLAMMVDVDIDEEETEVEDDET